MKVFTVVVLVVMGSLILSGCTPAQVTSPAPPVTAPQPGALTPVAPQKLTKMRYAYTAPSAQFAPNFVSKEEGLWEKYGIDMQMSLINTSILAVAAMLAGEIDFTSKPPEMLAGIFEGTPVTVITSGLNTVMFWLMVTPDIQKIEDLKGKRVGVTRIGASSDFILRYALNKWGIEKDVTVMAMGSLPTALAGMKTGAIQGGVFSSPIEAEARDAGFRELADLSAMGLAYQSLGMAAKKSLIAAKPDLVKNFVKGYIEGIHFFNDPTRKAASMKAISKYTGIVDPRQLERSYEVHRGKFDPVPYPDRGLQVMIDEIATRTPKIKSAKPVDFTDMRFVKELDESGFIKEMAQKYKQ